MIDLVESFNAAFRLQQEGRLVEAETLYRAVLDAAPEHPGSHHLLGLVEHQLGRHDAALASIKRAIELNGEEPNYHNNLGTVYRALGKLDEAIVCYRYAVGLRPDFAAAFNNLGATLLQKGESAQAQRALERALEATPDYAGAWFNLGNVLAARDEHAKAVEHYRRTLTLDPHHIDALNNLGAALGELGENVEAASCYQRVLALQPANAAAHSNFGRVLAQRDELDAAIGHFREAIALQPHAIDAHINLGNVLLEQGDAPAAHQSYERALALDPAHESAHWNDGLALLVQGDLAEGFRRWRYNVAAAKRFGAPEWRGEALNGAAILIHAEQGFGDAIHFARYIPMVAARGGRVIFEAPVELHRVFATIDGIDEIVAFGDRLPEFAWQCPLLSLPLAFGTTLRNVPDTVPYLTADAESVEFWQRRMAGPALKVGLVWAGRPEHKRDRHRSMALAELAPLAAIPNVAFYALQKGAAVGEAEHAPEGMRLEILSPLLGDFADTAAAIMALDLVITVDTSVAHLAGALGKPVWILNAYSPDWRWLEHRSDSPWYPTAELFRQDASRRWAPVVNDVAAELRALASGNSAAEDQAKISRIA
ncbi:MAG TPA: tetratricopeptide repeat protein [Stellaceae bacterium]|nr:tetratricopeptide repeat protein [Stellaceae bacterium]